MTFQFKNKPTWSDLISKWEHSYWTKTEVDFCCSFRSAELKYVAVTFMCLFSILSRTVIYKINNPRHDSDVEPIKSAAILTR